MLMLKAVAVFFTCLAVISVSSLFIADVGYFLTWLGWIVVVVYTANVMTRWILSVLPQEVVDLRGKAVLITGRTDIPPASFDLNTFHSGNKGIGMLMLKAVAVFFTCLAVISVSSLFIADVGYFLTWLGWIVVVVYTANVMTRWILSVLPQEVVDPRGKAVLITGCDTGFGLDLAHRLQATGFYVYACCLSEESQGAQELSQLTETVKVLSLDVTKYDQVQNAAKQVEADLGDKELWCVVNNAGIGIFSELEWCSMSIIEHMFHVNVLGAVRVTKVFLPFLRKSKGRVVIVASIAGHITYPGFLSYSMTKHALVSFADGLRREMLKWGVSVVTIEPTMYKTRIARSDILTGALDNSWEKTPEAIKEAYGFPYYQDFKVRMQKLAGKARPYLKEVVDCMEQAVSVVHPKLSYRCSGPADKIRFWIMSILPTQLVDLLICKIIQPSHRQLSGGVTNGKTSPS